MEVIESKRVVFHDQTDKNSEDISIRCSYKYRKGEGEGPFGKAVISENRKSMFLNGREELLFDSEEAAAQNTDFVTLASQDPEVRSVACGDDLLIVYKP